MMMLRHGIPAALLAFSSVTVSARTTEELVAELRNLKSELHNLQKTMAEQNQEMETAQRALQAARATPVLRVDMADYEKEKSSIHGTLDTTWVLICGTLVMVMHAGFAMLETGCCRAKNAQNVLMKNLVNVCVGTLGWWIFGWGFAYGSTVDSKLDNGFIGHAQFANSGFLQEPTDAGYIDPLNGADTSFALSWFFQWTFCTAGATIVSGGVAERVKSPSYALYAFVMASFIYPVVVAWTWGYGWLSDFMDVGYMDFAGSGIVHLCGGVGAFCGTCVLGPRKGRWENPDEFGPHSLPLVVLGTFILWFGWFGFNPGSTLSMHDKGTGVIASQVAMNTTIAAATAGIIVFCLRYRMTHLYDVGGLCNGILAGLVAITAGCSTVESGNAIIIAVIAGFVYQGASMLLVRLKIDDPVDAVPVHGFCGALGVLCAAIFDWGEGFEYYHGWSGLECTKDDTGKCMEGAATKAIVVQLVLIVSVIAWSGTLSSITFLAMKKSGILRIDEDTEAVGLDAKHHSPAKAYNMEPPAFDAHVRTVTEHSPESNGVIHKMIV
eukprot:TRINITY_DN2525_c1_g1_i1.p1 TRINITY_DN2525_c1_g1~~TRINITY_DN2525_c1_g1_i1.p1  ORF type:complete len:551 (-),score=111.50 TRINITY_DN2525_c1_g1_i1:218-1870(-)